MRRRRGGATSPSCCSTVAPTPTRNVYASGWPLSRVRERNDEAMKRLLIDRGAKPQPHMIAQAHEVGEARRMLEADAERACDQELTWSAAESGCPEIVELALPRLELAPARPALALDSDPADSRAGRQLRREPPATTDDLLKCMEMLLRHGIDPNVGRLGQTVLHFTAARGGDRERAERARFAAMLLDLAPGWTCATSCSSPRLSAGRAAGAARKWSSC